MLREWALFIQVRATMKQIDHPLMIELFNNKWKAFKKLGYKPKDINQSVIVQDYLRKALKDIKHQAESCLYYPYVRVENEKSKQYRDMVLKNSPFMLDIITLLKTY